MNKDQREPQEATRQSSCDEDPIARFGNWFARARHTEPGDPTAVALATATPGGVPSVRMVLLKDFGPDGFVFYTNLESRKGTELKANPLAALCFYWHTLDYQVRIEGRVSPVDDQQADAYFASRPRGSRIGAWASRQSQIMAHRFDLKQRVAAMHAKFALRKIPRPSHWGGMRLVPSRIEFWHQGQNRLHDRQLFERDGQSWRRYRLYP